MKSGRFEGWRVKKSNMPQTPKRAIFEPFSLPILAKCKVCFTFQHVKPKTSPKNVQFSFTFCRKAAQEVRKISGAGNKGLPAGAAVSLLTVPAVPVGSLFPSCVIWFSLCSAGFPLMWGPFPLPVLVGILPGLLRSFRLIQISGLTARV